MNDTDLATIHHLCEVLGVAPYFYDNRGRRMEASPEALLGILSLLEPKLDHNLANAEHVLAQYQNPILPKTIVCNPQTSWIAKTQRVHLEIKLTLEDGQIFNWSVPENENTVTLSGLPLGYHHLEYSDSTHTHRSLVICAPEIAYQPPKKLWGLFTPIYALRTKTEKGVGDWSDLEQFMNWVKMNGGDFVATLPILATALDGPDYESSPYSPLSRTFWNEFFIPWPNEVPELQKPTKAYLVDYKNLYAQKKQAWIKHIQKNPLMGSTTPPEPELLEYARLRAVCHYENKRPSQIKDLVQKMQSIDVNDTEFLFHLVTQRLCNQQIQRLTETTGVRLYLDFPVGVSGDGYDTWKHPDLFVQGASVGCPPDELFTLGQNWGFPPLHPKKLEESQFKYFIQSVRHHMKFASVLRLDHVMGLNRIFWIPQGKSGKYGAYVYYPHQALYAILRLESHRHQTTLVGEDLGVVPPLTRECLNNFKIDRIWVGQLECWRPIQEYLQSIPANAAASLNTHDLPTFASFWNMTDIEDRIQLKYLSPEEASEERTKRSLFKQEICSQLGIPLGTNANEFDVFSALTLELAKSQAQIAMINCEDLWLERLPQNTPGTVEERPNWQRRHQLTIHEMQRHDAINSLLKQVSMARRT